MTNRLTDLTRRGLLLLLAAALLAPGRRRRLDALRANALEAVTLVTGAMAMLILAAMVEAFWSSATAVPAQAKVLAGAVGWLLVALYFTRAGRGQGDAAG